MNEFKSKYYNVINYKYNYEGKIRMINSYDLINMLEIESKNFPIESQYRNIVRNCYTTYISCAKCNSMKGSKTYYYTPQYNDSKQKYNNCPFLCNKCLKEKLKEHSLNSKEITTLIKMWKKAGSI